MPLAAMKGDECTLRTADKEEVRKWKNYGTELRNIIGNMKLDTVPL